MNETNDTAARKNLPTDSSPVSAEEVDAYLAEWQLSPRRVKVLQLRAQGQSYREIAQSLGVSADRARQITRLDELRVKLRREPRTPYNVARDDIGVRFRMEGMNAWAALSAATSVQTKEEACALLSNESVAAVPGLSARYLSTLRAWVGVPSPAERRKEQARAEREEAMSAPVPDGVVAMRREEIVTVREYWSCLDDEHRHASRDVAERCVRGAMRRDAQAEPEGES